METILTNPYHDVFTDKELEAITKFKTALTTDKEKDLVPQSLITMSSFASSEQGS